ncbi:MAG: RidA family protein [Chloroflexi bacterium]|nr:RidA family protein [Chloroflexota bacterium]
MADQSRQHVSSGSPYEPRLGYSRAVRVGNIIAIGGTAAIGTDGKTVAPGDAAAQARRCLEIIRIALEGLGANLSHIIRTRILLTHIEDWERVGQVHGEVFGKIRPVTTVMQVTQFIDPDWLIEIEVDAVL